MNCITDKKNNKNILLIIIIVATFFLAFLLSSKNTYASSYVMDKAGVLNQQTVEKVAEINEKDLAKVKGHPEIAVITIKTTGNESIEDYAQEQAQKYHIGRKGWNNGVLFVVATDDRKVRMQTGYGVEDALPDDYINNLISGQTKDELHQGNWNDSVLRIVQQTSQKLQKESSSLVSPSEKSKKDIIPNLLVVSIVAIAVAGFVFWGLYKLQEKKLLDQVNKILKKKNLVAKMSTSDTDLSLLISLVSNTVKDDEEKSDDINNDISFEVDDTDNEKMVSADVLAKNLFLANEINKNIETIENNSQLNIEFKFNDIWSSLWKNEGSIRDEGKESN